MKGAPNQGASRVLVQDELLKKTKLERARGTAFREKRSEDYAEGMASHLD